MTEDPYIEGIFNYCDRWCERCAMTERCRLFADSQRLMRGEPREDLETAEPWQAGTEDDEADARDWLADLDLDDDEDEEAAFGEADPFADDDEESDDLEIDWEGRETGESEAPVPFRASREHSLTRTARDYSMAVHHWFKDHRELCDEQGELVLAHEIERQGPERAAEAARLSDAADIVRWYEFQITAKLARALSKDPEDLADDPGFAAISAYDANGSAKVALIGIDRSIDAWMVLRNALPAYDKPIAAFLQTLKGLRADIEQAFPEARAFVRPGFDD